MIGIRNPFNLQRSKLTSARVLGGGWGKGAGEGAGEGAPGKQETLALSARPAFVCALPSSRYPPPRSGHWGDGRPRASV